MYLYVTIRKRTRNYEGVDKKSWRGGNSAIIILMNVFLKKKNGRGAKRLPRRFSR